LIVENLHGCRNKSETVQRGDSRAARCWPSWPSSRGACGNSVRDWRSARRQQFVLKLALARRHHGCRDVDRQKLGFRLPKETKPVAWATLIGGVVILGLERWLRGPAANRRG